MKKTIIIPCYNEKSTILKVIDRVKSSISKEDNIIIIDDCSNDGTKEILKNIKDFQIKIIFSEKNQGKGSAVQLGLRERNLNEIIILQDADLEYNPKDFSKLLIPFKEANADVVYGSRFLGSNEYVRIHFFWHYIANKILTFLCNIFTNLNMTDMETGYKAFKINVIKDINLKEKSFGIEPEITIKLAKKKFKFFEVPISYAGRSYEEGKKIQFKDAIIAVFCIIKYGIFG
jgi:glycosyltransferase involved in cell wall biosynthesis